MVLCWIILISLIQSCFGEIISFPSNGQKLSLKVPPVKDSRVREGDYGKYTQCITFDSSTETEDVTFVISVQESLPYETDIDRFGPISSARGKQFLQLEIFDEYDNLLRGTRHLPNGDNVLQVNTHGSSQFRICLINLVYDGSWKSIDVEKDVTITVTRRDKLLNPSLKIITEEDCDLLNEVKEDLFHMVNVKTTQTLTDIEREHRDLNESSFELLMYQLIMVGVLSFLGNCVMVPYVVWKSKKPKQAKKAT